MRVLALDVGDNRIGTALSDPTGFLASPLTTITRSSEPEDIDSVLRLAQQNDVEAIVVGLPLSLSGRAGPQAKKVTGFTARLSERAAVPVKSVDERYSTAQAERLLRQAGAKPSEDRARVDAAAAAVILQSYLDSQKVPSDGRRDHL